jgi:hypothetical protein
MNWEAISAITVQVQIPQEMESEYPVDFVEMVQAELIAKR